ncbi:MAG: hypothetical protein ACQETQ_02605 [Spirochaetota bacterium]
MKRRLTLVYTVVTVVFFVTVIATLLLRLGAVREENLSAARDTFERTQVEIVENASDSQLPVSQIVQAAFRNAVAEDERTAAFAAYGMEENVEYLWARNQSYVEVSGSEREARRLNYDELSQTLLSSSVRMPGGDPILVEGVYTVLDRRDVFGLLRDALIAVLAFALIAVILAIITLLRPHSSRGAQRPMPHPADAAAAGAGTGPRRDSDVHSAAGTVSEYERAPGEHVENAAPRRDQSSEATPPRAKRETKENAAPAADTPAARTATADTPAADTNRADVGLFSPQSGLSPEAHLERRLSLELERAASNDQDLSICFVEYPGVERGSASYRAVAATLLEFFGFEDLIFEYGKSSFCLLFPNVELNETIQQVEDFQHRLLAGELGGQDGEGAMPASSEEPHFGISSRNGRLVEGGRMMKEARQALQKAKETSGHIMAFKPDPHKYRQFISRKDT